jgi:hypothetical protein
LKYENYPANPVNAAKKAALNAASERLQYEIARQKAHRNNNSYTNKYGTRHMRVMVPE